MKKKNQLMKYFSIGAITLLTVIEWLCREGRSFISLPSLKRNITAYSFVAVFILGGAAAGYRILDLIEPTPIYYDEYIVQKGDSLFAIGAREFDGPVEKAVFLIKEENNLESSVIQPGQKLKIPKVGHNPYDMSQTVTE